MTRSRRAPLAVLALALSCAPGGCSFIDQFPDVAPDPDPSTTTASTTGAGGASSGGGMGGGSTSSTSSTSGGGGYGGS